MLIQNNGQHQATMIKPPGERKTVHTFHGVAETWDMQSRDNILHTTNVRLFDGYRKAGMTSLQTAHTTHLWGYSE